MPRQDHVTNGTVTSAYVTTGNITSYAIYASTNGTTFTQVTSGTWAADGNIKRVQITPVTARYLRLEATAASGATYAVASEIDAGGVAAKPVVVGPNRIAPSPLVGHSKRSGPELQGDSAP